MQPAASEWCRVPGPLVVSPILRVRSIPLAPAELRPPATSIIPRGRVLFWQGDRQSEQIEILQGVVRAVRLLEDGTRQILAFYWAGDVVRPALAACQHYTAEAVTPCRVLRSRDSEVCASGKPCGANQVLIDTLSLVMAMSKKNSIARLAWFLLRIRPHLPSDPVRHHALRVLIPRADIADYLGTSMETVCRTLADFKSRGLIDLPNRKTIHFIDLAGLARVAGE
jgi:CRP-like cAMP-binding protein